MKNLTFVTTDLNFKINICLNLRKKNIFENEKNKNLNMYVIDINPAKDIRNFGLLRDLSYMFQKAQ